MHVERHSWCVGVLSLSRPGALCGIRAGSQGPGGAPGGRRGGWRVYLLGCARAGQIQIWGAGGSNPDWERARSNPDREHGRVKSETGEAPKKKKKTRKNKNLWLQPHSPESGVTAVRTVVITSLLATAVITAVETVVPEGVVATKV